MEIEGAPPEGPVVGVAEVASDLSGLVPAECCCPIQINVVVVGQDICHILHVRL